MGLFTGSSTLADSICVYSFVALKTESGLKQHKGCDNSSWEAKTKLREREEDVLRNNAKQNKSDSKLWQKRPGMSRSV